MPWTPNPGQEPKIPKSLGLRIFEACKPPPGSIATGVIIAVLGIAYTEGKLDEPIARFKQWVAQQANAAAPSVRTAPAAVPTVRAAASDSVITLSCRRPGGAGDSWIFELDMNRMIIPNNAYFMYGRPYKQSLNAPVRATTDELRWGLANVFNQEITIEFVLDRRTMRMRSDVGIYDCEQVRRQL